VQSYREKLVAATLHNADFARELADDFAVMDRGEIVMSGTREAFDAEAVRRHMTV
jgi:urea transport system ATP-binding protein